ncbi:MAG: 50S ribosomal protein L15 [Elusimicrobiota bacterium]|nr:50S ribosomal protein L15 [Elusimicrobiota bacterium]
MSLHNLRPAAGSKHRKKIIGRGQGSGHGGTATRGMKGQKSRSGDGAKKVAFEGGQMPIFRRLPKRGFNSPFRKEYDIVNVETLNRFENNTEITPQLLKENGLIDNIKLVKILGNGKLEKSLTVFASSFSKSAIDKITAAGGKTKIYENKVNTGK